MAANLSRGHLVYVDEAVRLVDAGSELDYIAFVTAASPRLLRAAELLVGDQASAQDLVQTALLKAYRRWPAIHGDPYAYTRKTMVTTATDWWRRRSHHERPSSRLPEGRVGDHADRIAQTDAIVRALSELSPRERAVIVLRYFDDLTEQSAAAVLGVSVGTVKSITSRALRKLRVSHQEQEAEESRC